ncbi:molybdenum cofactor guanylyltransferase [Heyndrickxia sp. NPDC080065]|uniref:molybdenum cofactor guanylyltransferase n=1 Tax=Heyndrickxia sp. NPDC080065 TaxID=3390568 RepID=UPI003D038529
MDTIILAGGQSSRMGTNKALLPFGKQRVIDRLINEFSPVSNKILLVTNQPEEYKDLHVSILTDHMEFKGQGPLAGIYTGLNEAVSSQCLVVACDMPFAANDMSRWFIHEMELGDYDAVIPSYHGRLHPLFGAYQTRIQEPIRNCLLSKKRRMTDLFNHINIKIVEQHDAPVFLQNQWENSLWNMNTMEDYKQALKKIAE